MAVSQPKPSPIEELRQVVADSPHLQAMDRPMLEALRVVGEGDFDDIVAQIANDYELRNSLGSWLVSADVRGLLTRLPKRGTRQWYAISALGRQQLQAGG